MVFASSRTADGQLQRCCAEDIEALLPQWISANEGLPKEEGYYWYKEFNDFKPVIVLLEIHIGIGEHANELLLDGWPVSLRKGFFAGPLPQPPKEGAKDV